MQNRLKFFILLCAALLAVTATPVHASETSAGSSDITITLPETAGDIPVIISEDTNEEGALVITLPAEEDVVADAAHDAHAQGGNVGLPQLKTDSYASQVFWLVISFVVLYTLMSRMALPRVTEVLDMRQTQKNGNLDRAEKLQTEADKIKAEYEASLARAHDAAHQAMSTSEAAIAEKSAARNADFIEKARKRVAEAEQGIAKAKEEALSSLADISAEIAADIVHKIADVQVQKADAKKVVLEEMKKVA